MSNSLWSHGLQHTRLPCPSPTSRACSTHFHWVGDAIQPSHPLLSPSPPAFNLSRHKGLFQWVSSLHQVAPFLLASTFPVSQLFTSGGRSNGASASASVLPVNIWKSRTDFLKDWLVLPLCSQRDSEESSPTPQFKSINSSVLSFLHSPTLTSIHDHRKNHSLD